MNWVSHGDIFKVKPRSKSELIEIINSIYYTEYDSGAISINPNMDLNFLDVSGITDLSDVFHGINLYNGDVSKWDVSNCTNFSSMFFKCIFNGDISKWDVSNGIYFAYMFNCSSFNCDISKWDMMNSIDTYHFLCSCPYNGVLPKLNLKNESPMAVLFNSKFENHWSKPSYLFLEGGLSGK